VGKPRPHGGSSSRSAYRELIIGRINKLSQLQASIRLSSLDMASGSLEDTDCADRQISGGRRACIHGNDCEFLHEVTSNSVSICYFDRVRPLNMKIRPVLRLHRKPYRLSHPIMLPKIPYSTAMVDKTRLTGGKDGNAIRTVKKINRTCRAWEAGNCKWGDKCKFQHEILVRPTGVSFFLNQ